MSTGTGPTPHEAPADAHAEGLQFDQAEFNQPEGGAAIACASCKRPIDGSYYEINGTILCDECRVLVEQHLKGGSKIGRLVRALLFGGAAAVLSAAIYFAVIHFAHIEAGLISVLCGFLVGKAVRAGTGNRGGWIYQVMAVVLTYLAIGAAYSASELAGGGAQQIIDSFKANNPNAPPSSGYLTVARVFVVIMVVAPVLVAKNILSLAIMSFALWEAFKFTKRAKVVVTGPYRVGGELAPDMLEGEPDGDH